MPIAPLAAIGTIVFTFVNFLKALTSKNFRAAFTQVVAWLSGVVAVVLAAKTDLVGNISLGSLSLDKIDGMTQVFLGLVASSILGVVNDIKKAIDTTDSAAQPPLIPLAKD